MSEITQIIGFSTGCLYWEKSMSFNNKIRLLTQETESNAIELSFPFPEDLVNWNSFPETLIDGSFRFISIHAPYRNIEYFGLKPAQKCFTDAVIEKLKRLCEIMPVKSVVFHPDVIFNLEKLQKSELPIALENMDSTKAVGRCPIYFRATQKNNRIKYVLDLFHTHENDHTMAQAGEFIGMWGDRLHHIHLSGRNDTMRHSLLFLADKVSKKQIETGLCLVKGLPIILEGRLQGNIIQRSKEELDLIRSLI